FTLDSGFIPTAIGPERTGSVDDDSFDQDIGNAFNDAPVEASSAWLVHATGGSFSGVEFLVLARDGEAAFTHGSDYIYDVTGHTGTLTLATFGGDDEILIT